jgi:SLOG cluster2/TIR domain
MEIMANVTPSAAPSTSSDIRNYRQRLVVYIVWHRDFAHGAEIARLFYDHLMRDSRQPLARGLGIPVYFRSHPDSADSTLPREIRLDEAAHTAAVVLVDDTMVLGKDDGWAAYVGDLHKHAAAEPRRHRVLPVMLSAHAFKLEPSINRSNFIRALDGTSPAAWVDPLIRSGAKDLLNAVTHELCRLLLNESRIVHDAEDSGGRLWEPVKIFISHTKRDPEEGGKRYGEEIAQSVREYVARNSQLQSFFDVNDVPFGSDFQRILENEVDREHTAVLVVQTDEYSNSEWCQREVLWAKKYERPVLILHAVRFGEKCGFPYLGNSPTIRYDPAAGPDLKIVLGQMLVEVLRNIHFRQHFENLRRLFDLPADVRALPQAPELLTLLELRDDPRNRGVTTVVHQDPPLGEHLLGVLRRFAPDLLITTPTIVLTAGRPISAPERPLSEKVIGLSISDSPSLDALGFHKIHLDDAAVEFARYLLESRAILAYGGDLRPGGFTALLRDLVWTYNATDGGIPERIRGYIAWPVHRDRLRNDPTYLKWTDERNRIKFRFVPRPSDLEELPAGPPAHRSPENLYFWARCLSAMRASMNEEIDARVLLGGKLEGYMGRWPGLVEEALLAKRSGKPIYLVGGFGGCTTALIDAIEGRAPDGLTKSYQYRDPTYQTMLERYFQDAATDSVDYASLVGEFQAWGVAGLSATNGLTAEDNRRLFETPHVIEMVALVLRGLLRVFGATT